MLTDTKLESIVKVLLAVVILSLGLLLPKSGKPVPLIVTTTPPFTPRLTGEIEFMDKSFFSAREGSLFTNPYCLICTLGTSFPAGNMGMALF